MYRAEFTSSDPLNDLPRVLDAMRKIGFQLCRASVDAQVGDAAHVNVQFLPRGQLSVATFIERISLLPGIESVTHSAIDQAAAA